MFLFLLFSSRITVMQLDVVQIFTISLFWLILLFHSYFSQLLLCIYYRGGLYGSGCSGRAEAKDPAMAPWTACSAMVPGTGTW